MFHLPAVSMRASSSPSPGDGCACDYGQHRGHHSPHLLAAPGGRRCRLDPDRGDQDQQQQPEGVDHDVAFAAVDALPGVVVACCRCDGGRLP
jgi:hypothetical protein